MTQQDAAQRLNVVQHLEHTVAVGIGNICLKPSKVGLVVMSEVKVLQPQLRVLQVDLPVALWYFDEWVINSANGRLWYSPFALL